MFVYLKWLIMDQPCSRTSWLDAATWPMRGGQLWWPTAPPSFSPWWPWLIDYLYCLRCSWFFSFPGTFGMDSRVQVLSARKCQLNWKLLGECRPNGLRLFLYLITDPARPRSSCWLAFLFVPASRRGTQCSFSSGNFVYNLKFQLMAIFSVLINTGLNLV